MTLLRLARKAARDPQRAVLRMVLKARLARRSERRERHRLYRAISAHWGVDAWGLAAEYHQSQFARWFRYRREELQAIEAGSRMGTSSGFTLEAMYVLVRAARPELMVETGVLYGASSGHILAALEANGTGHLSSIDLGCGPGEPPHDYLVPPAFQPRWEYIVGDSRRELPRLLQRLGPIDLFHHDSLHTAEHMTWEYTTAAPYLRAGGVLSSHDVLVADSVSGIFRENAFPAFCRRWGARFILAGNSGIALRPEPRVQRSWRGSGELLAGVGG